MTSPQHRKWIAAGSHWQAVDPILALAMKLRWYGYTVYILGDDGHLDHIPPEDHTPYSETGWPVPTPYGWVTACDVMPPGAAQRNAGLPSLQQLGAQLFGDKQLDDSGVKWIKYMNWGPLDDRRAVHDRWQPGHVRSASGDVGHMHISARSDMIHYKGAAIYDPVARLRGVDNPVIIGVEDPMPFVAKDAKSGQYYVCDLITSRPVPADAVGDVLYLAKQLNYGHGAEGVEWTDGGWTRLGWTEAAFGTLLKPGGDNTSSTTAEVSVTGTLTLTPVDAAPTTPTN